ncbi:hypothetical protein Aab01nite_43750 [Paractinoplanes abujensis]|uniref:Uncharacterized protein n=1 Tax=Paractinoplanes abujensis TaxID=882441 RepID=A0A7W7CK60_9ACTN|nr:hypothetical protein [Actinoplanes abujensis]MBB4690013.1 hypothetical protein [Actinoplanes abujensis]GID20785.1 hypothetical protein Aab01nite_43750 [Actinoplanes abujensis]
MTKKLILDGREWGIADADADGVARLVRDAMLNRIPVELTVYDADENAVTLFLNGAATPSVVLDLNAGPRPSQMS